MYDIFKGKNIKPMLIGNNTKPYNDKDSIFELKLDGIRCIAYIDKNCVILKNKRNKDVSNIYPELLDINNNITNKCILDGEIIVLKNGKPDFFSVQKRSLITNQFKIKLAMNTLPVSFVVFDILYLKNENVMDKPLLQRKKLLESNIKQNEKIAISKFIENDGIKFYELAKLNNLEGIVGKKKNSIYIEGIRTKSWKKIKVMVDEDLIICGYDIKNSNINSLILATIKNDKLICRGKLSLGISNEEKEYILNYAKNNKINKPYFNEYKNVEWIKLDLIGTVEYMHETENNHMRQPIWKGLKLDN